MKLASALVWVGVSTLAGATAAGDLAALHSRGELRWGGDLQGGEPYVFEDDSRPGKIQGFEVDIADALARRLGVRAVFKQTDWSTLVPALERGDFDVILNGLEDTPERRERLLLSIPYFVYGETLTVRKDARYTGLDDLRGKRVGTLNQTVAHDILKTKPLEIVLYEGQQEPYFDLSKGRTEAVLLDHVIADRYGCPLENLRCLPGDVARGSYVLGIRRSNPELSHAVDAALGQMIGDGELRGILTHWKLWDARQETLKPPPPADTAPSPAERPSPRRFGATQTLLFLESALVTLILSIASFLVASPLGIAIAIARLYAGKFGRALAVAYVELFRGTPLLLQLYVLYFGIAEFVRLGPMTAAILGLGLNYAAYEAEVHRGALLALPRGQAEAARALGLGRWQTLRHVLLPQSLKNALPLVTNDFVALLKDSSLVSVITVVELTKRMTIVAVELRDWVVPGAVCAGLYFSMSFLWRASRAGSSGGSTMIRIRALCKSFGTRSVLDRAEGEIPEGAVVAVVGASGSGKTTLLRCLNALEPFDAGQIEIAGFRLNPGGTGSALDALRSAVGVVFQDYQLFPHLTALDNIALAPRVVKKLSRIEADRLSRSWLDRVGLGDRADARPSELSGGQKQRVALARALAQGVRVLLLDEPTSALDTETREDVRRLLADVVRSGSKEHSLTLVTVTHDLAFAADLADELWVLDQGKFAERRTPRAPQ